MPYNSFWFRTEQAEMVINQHENLNILQCIWTCFSVYFFFCTVYRNELVLKIGKTIMRCSTRIQVHHEICWLLSSVYNFASEYSKSDLWLSGGPIINIKEFKVDQTKNLLGWICGVTLCFLFFNQTNNFRTSLKQQSLRQLLCSVLELQCGLNLAELSSVMSIDCSIFKKLIAVVKVMDFAWWIMNYAWYEIPYRAVYIGLMIYRYVDHLVSV